MFLFKQKTAYEMRISDWSSDVCSSDLNTVISAAFLIGSALAAVAGVMITTYYGVAQYTMGFMLGLKAFTAAVLGGIGNLGGAMLGGLLLGVIESLGAGYIGDLTNGVFGSNYQDRSEEHTSELQSLMRISYAVFCLKKKKPKKNL